VARWHGGRFWVLVVVVEVVTGEEGLAVVVGGCFLIHLISMCLVYLSCTHDLPYDQLLIGMGWCYVPHRGRRYRRSSSSTPRAVAHEAGGGWCVICRHCCWDWHPPSCSQPWRSRPTRHPPHEQLLVRLRMAMGSSSAGSTHDAPYEQLLVGLGAGAGSAFYVGGRCRVPATWHREGVGWCMPHGRPPPRVSQCPSLVSAGPR
jgi:hypothetical protein